MAGADPSDPISPPVARTLAVLNFLAGHPDQAFTLTELAKSLRLSSATCHTLLAALTQAGYVYRTAGKTYVLGPALARVGQASRSPGLVMHVARPEMRLLADEFDVVCSAYVLEAGSVRIFERAAAVSHIDWHVPPRLSLPLIAPIGIVFMGWKPPEDVEGWLAAAEPPLTEAERTRYRAAIRFMAERGWSFGARIVPIASPQQARALLNRQALTDYALGAIEAERQYPLAYVAAPVFSAPGTVSFGLSLAGFVQPAHGAAIEAMGARLRAACDRIGSFVAGRELANAEP